MAVWRWRYGSNQLTFDIDLVPVAERTNLDRLASAMRELQAKVIVYADRSEIHLSEPIWTAQVLLDNPFLHLRTYAGDVDLLLKPTGLPDGYNQLVGGSVEIRLHGLVIHLAGLDDIATSKERQVARKIFRPLTRSNDSGVTHIDRTDEGVAPLPGIVAARRVIVAVASRRGHGRNDTPDHQAPAPPMTSTWPARKLCSPVGTHWPRWQPTHSPPTSARKSNGRGPATSPGYPPGTSTATGSRCSRSKPIYTEVPRYGPGPAQIAEHDAKPNSALLFGYT